MSLHPDAFLDYGTEGATLSIGDLVECKYLHPKDRDGVLITEVIESSANAGSANRDMSTVAQDAVKGMFEQVGQAVGSVYDKIMGEPEKQNIYEAMKAGKQVEKLPLTLGEALDRLENDDVIKSALPDEMLKVFMHYKRDEWEKFLSAVTQWDVDTYLDILP